MIFRSLFIFIMVWSGVCRAKSYSAHEQQIHFAMSANVKSIFDESKALQRKIVSVVQRGHCDPYKNDYKSNYSSRYYYACIVEHKEMAFIVFSKMNWFDSLVQGDEALEPAYKIDILTAEMQNQIQSQVQLLYRTQKRVDLKDGYKSGQMAVRESWWYRIKFAMGADYNIEESSDEYQ